MRILNGTTTAHEPNDPHKRHEKKNRRHTPPTLRHTEHSVNHLRRNSDEIEEMLEEKWPSPNEIRRYSQVTFYHPLLLQYITGRHLIQCFSTF